MTRENINSIFGYFFFTFPRKTCYRLVMHKSTLKRMNLQIKIIYISRGVVLIYIFNKSMNNPIFVNTSYNLQLVIHSKCLCR